MSEEFSEKELAELFAVVGVSAVNTPHQRAVHKVWKHSAREDLANPSTTTNLCRL